MRVVSYPEKSKVENIPYEQYVTCPQCGYFIRDDYCSSNNEEENMYNHLLHAVDKKRWQLKGGDLKAFDQDFELYNILSGTYCVKCNILFKLGCRSSDDYWYPEYIAHFEFDGTKHKGMPVFDSFKEFLETHAKYKIIMWQCRCPKCHTMDE